MKEVQAPLTPPQEIEELQAVLSYQAITPPNDDIYIGTWARATYRMIKDQTLQPVVTPMFEWRREYMKAPLDPHLAPSLLFRGVQRQAIKKRGIEDYLSTIKTVEGWVRIYQEILQDTAALDDLQEDLSIRTVQSNIPERYKSLKLLMMLFPERFPEPPRVMDMGCSLNLGLKKIVLSDHFPFHRVEVLGILGQKQNLEMNLRASQALNSLLAGQIALGASTGIDIWNFAGDKNTESWALSNSVTPKELKEKPYLYEEMEQLVSTRPPEVSFFWGDVTSEQDMHKFPPPLTLGQLAVMAGYERKNEDNQEKFDVATSYTFKYLLTEEERRQAEKFAQEHITEEALDIEQDFGTISKANPSQIAYAEDIYATKFQYRTFVRDRTSSPNLQPMFIWETGRCERLWLGLGKISVNGRMVSIPDILGLTTSRSGRLMKAMKSKLSL